MLHPVPFLENALDPASYEYSNEVKKNPIFPISLFNCRITVSCQSL